MKIENEGKWHMKDFTDIYPAFVTYFINGEQIDEKALSTLIEWNIRKGIHGFYACDSTVEVFLLSEVERRYFLKGSHVSR